MFKTIYEAVLEMQHVIYPMLSCQLGREYALVFEYSIFLDLKTKIYTKKH